jgi:hypothetical protein
MAANPSMFQHQPDQTLAQAIAPHPTVAVQGFQPGKQQFNQAIAGIMSNTSPDATRNPGGKDVTGQPLNQGVESQLAKALPELQKQADSPAFKALSEEGKKNARLEVLNKYAVAGAFDPTSSNRGARYQAELPDAMRTSLAKGLGLQNLAEFDKLFGKSIIVENRDIAGPIGKGNFYMLSEGQPPLTRGKVNLVQITEGNSYKPGTPLATDLAQLKAQQTQAEQYFGGKVASATAAVKIPAIVVKEMTKPKDLEAFDVLVVSTRMDAAMGPANAALKKPGGIDNLKDLVVDLPMGRGIAIGASFELKIKDLPNGAFDKLVEGTGLTRKDFPDTAFMVVKNVAIQNPTADEATGHNDIKVPMTPHTPYAHTQSIGIPGFNLSTETLNAAIQQALLQPEKKNNEGQGVISMEFAVPKGVPGAIYTWEKAKIPPEVLQAVAAAKKISINELTNKYVFEVTSTSDRAIVRTAVGAAAEFVRMEGLVQKSDAIARQVVDATPAVPKTPYTVKAADLNFALQPENIQISPKADQPGPKIVATSMYLPGVEPGRTLQVSISDLPVGSQKDLLKATNLKSIEEFNREYGALTVTSLEKSARPAAFYDEPFGLTGDVGIRASIVPVPVPVPAVNPAAQVQPTLGPQLGDVPPVSTRRDEALA